MQALTDCHAIGNIMHEQELLDAGDQLIAYLAQQAQAVPARQRSPAGIVRLTLRPAQCRDEHSPAPLPSASLSARNHQPCRLALPQILPELPGC